MPPSRDATPSGVTVEHVSVRYPNTVLAVEDVSFTATPGEFLAIVGPSGCGKSSLLRAIAGLVRPTSGRVAFDAGPQTRVGFVFQSDALLPWKTAQANIELALRLACHATGTRPFARPRPACGGRTCRRRRALPRPTLGRHAQARRVGPRSCL